MDMDQVVEIITNLGTAGILGWYLWYTTSVSEPKRDDKYIAGMDKISADFQLALAAERADLATVAKDTNQTVHRIDDQAGQHHGTTDGKLDRILENDRRLARALINGLVLLQKHRPELSGDMQHIVNVLREVEAK